MKYTNEENLSVCCAYPMDDADICSRCREHTSPIDDED